MNRALLFGAIGAGGYLAYRALRPRFDFRGKHVVITGGSRGLGLVLARELSKVGARLTICSRDPEELVRAHDDLAFLATKILSVECDLTDRKRVDEMIATARQRNGPIDVLINNAGTIQVGPLEVMREEDFAQSLQTHFWAALYTSLAAIPEMRARKSGRIINISSIGGKVAVPHLLPYTVGKFALVGLSNGLRVELAKSGIIVTTVCPGLMRTGSHLNAQFKGQREKEYNWFATANSIPGFSMSAEEAARKILNACARGDAELVLGLPAKAAVVAEAICPNLISGILALVNRAILPKPSGDSSVTARGSESRGRLPSCITTLTDRAALTNNETKAADLPPPLPVSQ